VALHDSEPFAKSLGIDEYRHLLLLFGISAFIAGIMGAFYAHYTAVIDPNIFSVEIFLLGFAMLMLGGMAAFPGAAIGAFPIIFINYTLAPLQELRLVIMGIIIVAVMIGLPRGLMEIPEAINRLIRQRASKKSG